MIRYHSRFFVRVGPETMYAAKEKDHFFTIKSRKFYKGEQI